MQEIFLNTRNFEIELTKKALKTLTFRSKNKNKKILINDVLHYLTMFDVI